MRRLKHIVATAVYIGHIPGAPGTYASIAPCLFFAAAGRPSGAAGYGAAAALVLAGLWAASGAPAAFGRRDPGEIVIDEMAGMWLALVIAGAQSMASIAAAFVLFRFFDILKPFPIGRLERLDGSPGIMADDVAAGLAAGALVRLALCIGILS